MSTTHQLVLPQGIHVFVKWGVHNDQEPPNKLTMPKFSKMFQEDKLFKNNCCSNYIFCFNFNYGSTYIKTIIITYINRVANMVPKSNYSKKNNFVLGFIVHA